MASMLGKLPGCSRQASLQSGIALHHRMYVMILAGKREVGINQNQESGKREIGINQNWRPSHADQDKSKEDKSKLAAECRC